MKTSRHRALKNPPQKLSSSAKFALVFFSGVILTALAFVSLDLAILALCCMTLAAFVMTESARRTFWEHAASYKFKTLKDGYETLQKDVKNNTQDIQQINRKIATLLQTRALPKDETHKNEPASVASDQPMPFTAPVSDQTVAPRAIRPRQILDTPDLSYTQTFETDLPLRDPERKFDSLSDTIVRELLLHALEHKRIEVFVQPVMRLPQRQTRYYEIFSRIRAQPGEYIPAARYRPIAEQDNLHHAIDNMLLFHCLKILESSAHLPKATPFFLNVTGETLIHTPFMKRLLTFMGTHRALAPRLIFEMPQHHFHALAPDVQHIIRGLGRLGCQFSLDHVTDLSFDVPALQALKVSFVKIGLDYFLSGTTSDRSFSALHRSKRILEANGIHVIIEKIETETQLKNLLDYDIHYGQGYLFGRPDLQGAYQKKTVSGKSG